MKRTASCLAVLAFVAACGEGSARPLTAPATPAGPPAASFSVTTTPSLNLVVNGSFESPAQTFNSSASPWQTFAAGSNGLTG